MVAEKQTIEGKNNNASQVFLAFALGSLVGGLLALLYAPASGKETRAKIKGKVEDTKQGITTRRQNIKESTKAKYHETTHRFKSAIIAGREAFTHTKNLLSKLPELEARECN